MNGMESDIVDSVDKRLVLRSWRLVSSVTLEGKVGACVLVFHVSSQGQHGVSMQTPRKECTKNTLNSNAPFDAAYCKTVCGGEA